MRRVFTLFVVLAALIAAAEGGPNDCEYRFNPGRVDWTQGVTFDDLRARNTGFNYPESLLNNEDYYRRYGGTRKTTPAPPALTAPWYLDLDYVRETHPDPTPGEPDRQLLAQFLFQRHSPPSDEAVIAIHGSSVIPNDWASGQYYLRNGRQQIFAEGFDFYAPYVTHVASFNSATRRIAGAYGDEGYTIDLLRVKAVFAHVKAMGYEKIHIVGVSYGGQLAVYAARDLRDDPTLGFTLAIEGWFPSAIYTEDDEPAQEWWPNWECTFPGIQLAEFSALPANVYLAHGSCPFGQKLATWYADLPAERVIRYTGAHEYVHSAFDEAASRAGY